MTTVLDTADRYLRDRARVRHRYLELLRRDASPLLANDRAVTQLRAQLDGVLAETYAGLGLAPTAPVDDDESGAAVSLEIGASRAVSGVHPSQSLHAASLIFEAVLPVLATRLAESGAPATLTEAGVLLNRVILGRMSIAAESYVGHLLEKIHRSNHDERRRMSRELHDVVAPSIALALQDLQLHDAYQDAEPQRAAAWLDASGQAMNEAMASIRTLVAQSRDSVGRDGLGYAISTVLAGADPMVAGQLEVRGDPNVLPPAYQEELFLIVQEAVRNALRHSAARHVRVRLVVEEFDVVAEIHDDGSGFDPAAASGRGFGLTSMRERAEILDACLAISSASDAGTVVTLKVPLPRTLTTNGAASNTVATGGPAVDGGRDRP